MIEFTTPTGLFNVESYGNGWAYTVTCNTTGESFSCQDGAAVRLQSNTGDFTDEIALAQYIPYD